jgi:hypothetical protein
VDEYVGYITKQWDRRFRPKRPGHEYVIDGVEPEGSVGGCHPLPQLHHADAAGAVYTDRGGVGAERPGRGRPTPYTCPRHTYTHNDAEFRDRVQRAYLIVLMACLNLRGMLTAVRAGVIFKEQHRLYARGPMLVETCAFLYGRSYGHWECGAIEQIPMIDAKETAALLKGRLDLREQLKELKEIATESVLRVAEAVQETIGMGVGVEALSQWEGFSRFCRNHLGVEAMTLLRAYGVEWEDPAAEVLTVYPEAKADEARAAERERHWAREWERAFGRAQ